MIPGLHGALAEAPGLLEAYQLLHKLFTESSFDNDEQAVVWQTINVEHECRYCVPAHTAIAHMHCPLGESKPGPHGGAA